MAALGDGAHAAIEWRARGVAPDGAGVSMAGTNVVQVASGQFAEFHADWCVLTG